MKKILSLVAVALLVALCVFALASCGEPAEVKIGENGNWFIGDTDTGVKAAGTDAQNVTIGQNGNWFIGTTDTGVKAAGTDAQNVTIGENGNWFIGTTDTGVKAVSGKYVVNVESSVELDKFTGENVVTTVITYSDGTTETQKSVAAQKVESIYLTSFTGRSYVGYTPALMLRVHTQSGSYTKMVTDDMYVGAKPDFNTPGTYKFMLAYGGRYTSETITVYSADGVVLKSVQPDFGSIRIGTSAKDCFLNANFIIDNNNHDNYLVSMADCTELNVSVFDKAGITEFSGKYKNVTFKSNIVVYDPAVNNISSISFNSGLPTIPVGADATMLKQFFDTNLVGGPVDINFYEAMFGSPSMSATVTPDMIDYSTVNTAVPGRHYFSLTVDIDGIGQCTATRSVEVAPDMSSAIITDILSATNSTISGFFGGLELYDNGFARFNGSAMDMGYLAYTINENVLTAKTGVEILCFTIDTVNDTYEVLAPAGTASATYVNVDIGMKVFKYADYIVIATYSPAQGDTPEMVLPVYCVPASVLVNNTLSVSGMTITLNADGTITPD